MAKLRRRTLQTSGNGRGGLADVTVPLGPLLDADGQGDTLTANQAALLRRLRLEVDETAAGTAFDLRHVLHLSGHALAEWRDARARWIADLFAGDARVQP